MSIKDIGNNLHGYVDELIDRVSGKSSDIDCEEALKRFLTSTYHSLGSLSWYLGADGKVFQREAVPAADLVDDAFFEIMREREFEAPTRSPVYSTMNREQQFGAIIEGAQL